MSITTRGPVIALALAIAPGMARAAPQDETAPGSLSTADPPGATAPAGVPWRSWEQFNAVNGELLLSHRDIHIPGNGGLPIQLYRTYRWSEGQQRDPGFQFKRTAYRRGNSDYAQLRCSNATLCLCPPAAQCPTSVAHVAILYDMAYTEFNPSTGKVKPGGVWKFAVAPELEVQAAGAYFQPTEKWDPSARLPVTRAVDMGFLHRGLCGTAAPVYGGRELMYQVVLREPGGAQTPMYRTATNVLRSAHNWELRCEADTAPAPRLRLFAPNGVRYDLGQEVPSSLHAQAARWLTTRATDLRTGAWFTVAYDASVAHFTRPTLVTASDGRTITLIYDATTYTQQTLPYPASLRAWQPAFTVTAPVEPVLTEARTSTGSWTYTYNPPSQDAPLRQPYATTPATGDFIPPARRALATAVLPGGAGSWKYTYIAAWNPDVHTNTLVAGDQMISAVEEPHGLRVQYLLASDSTVGWAPARLRVETSWTVAFGRFCLAFQHLAQGGDTACPPLYNELLARYTASDIAARRQYVPAVYLRTAIDPVATARGIKGARVQSSITYSRATQPLGGYDQTSIITMQIDGTAQTVLSTETYFFIGAESFPIVPQSGTTPPATTDDAWRIGTLVRHELLHGSQAPNRVSTFEWTRRTYAPGPYYARSTVWRADAATSAPVLAKQTTSWGPYAPSAADPAVTTTYSEHTAYGSPQKIVREGPDPSAPSGRRRRTTTLTYYTDPARSLIDLPKNEVTQ